MSYRIEKDVPLSNPDRDDQTYENSIIVIRITEHWSSLVKSSCQLFSLQNLRRILGGPDLSVNRCTPVNIPKPPLGRLKDLEQMRLSGGTNYKSTDSRNTLGGHENCRTAVNIPKFSLGGRVSWLRCRQGLKREPPRLWAAPATSIVGDL